MSYAEAAAKGARQSADEVSVSQSLTMSVERGCRAPAQPQVERTDDSVSSLVDVDSPRVSSVPTDFESQSVKTDTQAARIDAEEEAHDAKQKAKDAAEKAKAKSKRGGNYAKANAENPVFIANALAVGVLGTTLGVGAYRKYVRDELTWKVAGAWAGIVGVFGAAQYFGSQWLAKKYPPKN
ncbi:hypothetical protein P280DRAFT_550283 [Massarina eburnea CBS 473.64]|uniref:Uncharacterized protein n=1 Tax=Massarina eburnea CBS 473.64 TaxID=1395130 RepID=A0A6A6S035_9PLEO|nr:hypothetical protein P280DRAFT_550283 [Massarina eburnea CBS 473.64]